MIDPIENALNELYQRQITTKEQLLTEMLRVKLTQEGLTPGTGSLVML